MTAWDPPQQSDAQESELASALTVDPFNSLLAHYGMLLGVSDFQVLGANPRGKLRLHQAWQHGAGVIWGFDVALVNGDSLRVSPGLAVDALGREVACGAEMCLDLPAWCRERQATDTGFKPGTGSPPWRFSARLWVRHTTCLGRRVPSVSSSCAQGDDSVQYSRVHEFGRLELEPYTRSDDLCAPRGESGEDRAPCLFDDAFEPLRSLVRDGTVPDLPREPDGWVDAFRAVSAKAAAQFRPPGHQPGGEGTLLFPCDGPGCILLADLPSIVIERGSDNAYKVTVEPIDLSVRRTSVPTMVTQELLLEALTGLVGPRFAPDAGGPRVRRMFVSEGRVNIDLTGNVVEGTIGDALEVHSIDRAAANPSWSQPIRVRTRYAETTAEDDARISFRLPEDAGDIWYRVLVRGTGPTPLLGLCEADLVPLAGRVGDPAARRTDGRDVVDILRKDGAS
ncbi:hypothetical protein [Terrabacter sp. Soil810]|uniref:hypothetical protein n=1 Tax=Terrabacter sp. Soil810 TaxID=1736418 RepID=UPI00070E674B|nr:hypothetical protein [Terrabacter sp. Soil810]KRF46293.1 hypothetical protein ASG96_20600 [Terrabacter sp. Soil810]